MAFSDVLNRLNATALGRFGVVAELDGQEVQGDFGAAQDERMVGGMPVSASNPMFVLADGDVPSEPVGKQLVHDGETYNVMAVEADGQGLTTLHLQVGI